MRQTDMTDMFEDSRPTPMALTHTKRNPPCRNPFGGDSKKMRCTGHPS